MRIAVAREADPAEDRVAATPETVKKMKALGADVAVEPGAGIKSGIPDAEFTAAGASVSADAVNGADVVLRVRRPGAAELAACKRGALVIAIMDPYGNEAALKTMADAGVTAFAMELMPRITRAQVMDVLSSQANLAGYRAVIDAAAEYGRALPMMMTAAGTIPAAKIFVMGKLDDSTIAAALLHDTIEDTEATRDEIDQMFGKDIGALVEGLTKLKKLDL
ncbi:MAG TPA: HD domain-containing protein, partial [Xanthobacteraceae bacterium]